MGKKSDDIPLYSLPKDRPINIHLRYIKNDLEENRPDYEVQHRDNYYIFLLQRQGELQLMVDFEIVTLKGACLYSLLPGQVHKFISSSNSIRWVLATEALNIDKNFQQALEEMYQCLSVPLGSHLWQQFNNGFQTLYKLLGQETIQEYKNSILSHMISVCAGLYVSTYLAAYRENKLNYTRPKFIERKFRTLLRKNVYLRKSPSDYANLLNLSPNYLNECVRNISGKPISYWIQQEMSLEAKRLLAFSKLSIKQIAFSLGYDDHAYFSRQFVKIVGTTPARFRENYHK